MRSGSVTSSEKPPCVSVHWTPGRHPALERGEQRIAPSPVLAQHAHLVAIEQALATEVIHRGLDERARVDVGQVLGHLEPIDQLGRRHDPAETQSREQDLREGPDVDDEPRAVERLQRRRAAVRP